MFLALCNLRSGRVYLDLHIKGRRRRVFSELPDTPRNRQVLAAKAETIEREVFLGVFSLEKHFPRTRSCPVTVQELYGEWARKKATEVSALTLRGYRDHEYLLLKVQLGHTSFKTTMDIYGHLFEGYSPAYGAPVAPLLFVGSEAEPRGI